MSFAFVSCCVPNEQERSSVGDLQRVGESEMNGGDCYCPPCFYRDLDLDHDHDHDLCLDLGFDRGGSYLDLCLCLDHNRGRPDTIFVSAPAQGGLLLLELLYCPWPFAEAK